jgi:hypothetical protein
MGCTDIDECACTSSTETDACGYYTPTAAYPASRERFTYHDCATSLN